MIYPIDQLISIMTTLSPTFEATSYTCEKFTIRGTGCTNCYFDLDRFCGATFRNPDWQASLDQVKLTNPELFV